MSAAADFLLDYSRVMRGVHAGRSANAVLLADEVDRECAADLVDKAQDYLRDLAAAEDDDARRVAILAEADTLDVRCRKLLAAKPRRVLWPGSI
jgi:hypothetical protein